jgi:hypothetical protein
MTQPPISATWIPAQAKHYALWIDGVGGYLVCLGHRISLGQPSDSRQVDVPILADLSRHHATVHRESEGYFLEAVRKTQVNGQQVEKTWLRSGDRITLGTVCQVRFTQAVPVSASARLDVESGHRWLRPVEAVLLMAETIVLGPSPQSHVLIPDLPQAMILYRHKEGLAVRYGGELAINGNACRERGNLAPGARISADDWSMTLEALGAGSVP